jgi:hypothetical protein
LLESHLRNGLSMSTIVGGRGFDWRDLADQSDQTTVVESVDPFERRHRDGLQIAPRTAFMNELRLVQPVDRLGQRIVIRVAYATHRLHPAFVAGRML